MGWSIGWDNYWKRDIGYGVPSLCDHPECSAEIDRGLAYVCGGEPKGGDKGCGLYFCGKHQVGIHQRCERCAKRRSYFDKKPDTVEWMRHKLRDATWKQWRDNNPDSVQEMREAMRAAATSVSPTNLHSPTTR